MLSALRLPFRVPLPLDVFGLPYPDSPWLVGLHNLSDFLIGLCYTAISATLLWLVYRGRRAIPFNWMFLVFGAFIVACGMTHFMHVLTGWNPDYWWLLAAAQAATVVASLFAAVLLPPLVPEALNLVGSALLSEQRKVLLETTNAELTERIAERERAELALRANEASLIAAQRVAQLGSYELDLATGELRWSAELYRVYGLDPQRCFPSVEAFLRLVHPDDVERVAQEIRQDEREGIATPSECRIVRPDGTVRTILHQPAITRDAAGHPVHLLGIVQDITARKAAEAARRESEARFRGAFDHAAIGMALVAPGGRWLQVNRTLCGILGYPEAELLATTFQALTHPDDLAADLNLAARLLADEIETYQLEKRYRHREGHLVWALLSVALVRDDAGQPRYFVSQIQDITARKEAETALRASEARQRAILDATPDLMFRLGRDGEYRDIHANDHSQLYLPPGELLGRKLGDVLPPEAAGEILGVVARALDTGAIQVYEYQLPTLGGVRAFEGRVVPSGADEVLFIARDITERKTAEVALRESEAALREAQGLAHLGNFWRDFETGETFFSDELYRIHGFAPGEVDLGATGLIPLVHPEDASRVRAWMDAVLGGQVTSIDHRVVRPDGAVRQVQQQVELVRADVGRPRRLVGTMLDVTERVAAEAALRESEARYRQMFEGNRAVKLVIDPAHGTIVDANPAACAFYGYRWEELTALRITDLNILPPDTVAAEMAAAHAERRNYFLFRHRLASGEIRDVEVHSSPLIWRDRQLLFSIVHDVSERRALEAQLEHQAFHDSLTGLPNRALFRDRLEQALARAARHAASVAILFLDLDRFKDVNDSLGHPVGDELLVAVGRCLQGCVRPGDTVARLGGDEFALLLETVDDGGEATRVAERAIAALRSPFTVAGREVFASASIGIVLSAADRDRPAELMRDVDVALYRAKAEGGGRYAIFNRTMHSRALERLELEADLRRSLERGEFVLHFQPQVDLATGRIVGAEALLRWQHPTRGLVPPGEFIPLAEETGLIHRFGAWALTEACRQARTWGAGQPAACAPLVAVNLSAREFQHPDLVAEVATALRETGLDPCRLELEITESIAMGNVTTTIATLRRLKELGVRLAIDDFGTGYSSLAYLKRFPVDTLKIDRAFVAGLGQEENDSAIVRAMLTLAEALELQVTAEGVETAEQADWLRERGCALAQGYYFARPLNAEAIGTLLATGEAASGLAGAASPTRSR